jgi:hypothetical protein
MNMTPDESKDALREKHLATIQAIISRLAGNSFEVRKWSVGVITVILGFTADKADWRLAFLALLAALVFWYLDSFYLYQERRFRTLFERIRQAPVAQLEAQPYFLNPDYRAGESAFPVPSGAVIPKEETVFSVAFRDGLVQLHWLTIVVTLCAVYYFYK